MRIPNPYLLTALLLLAHSTTLFAKNSDHGPDAELLADYDKGVKATERTSPVVKRLFARLHECVPSLGQGQVAEAEGKAEAERAAQSKVMGDSVDLLKKADAAIKQAMNSQLKRRLHIDTSKVDVCQGESDTFKKLLADAKAKAKAGAARKIESIASDLKEKLKDATGKINAQMRKNSHDKPTDIAGINKAKGWVVTPGSKKACDDAIEMVSTGATNKDLDSYESYLRDLDKKVSAWQNQKNAEVAAEIDAKIDQQVAPKLVDRNKCGSAVAQKAANDKKQGPGSSVSGPEKPAPVATAKGDKAAVTGQPAKTVEAAKAEAAPKVAAATQKAEVKENAANSVAGDVFKEVPPPNAEASDITGLKPLTAKDIARTDTYQSNSTAEIQPTKDLPATQALDAPEATEDNAESPQLRKDYAELSKAYEEAARPFKAPEEATAEASDVTGLKPLTADDVAKTDTYQPNSTAEIKPTQAMPGIDTFDNSSSKQMKAAYQQNDIFTKRDLDFNSSKDTKYIQNALNQVRAQNGIAALSADGVFGSRTTVALDQVMQDPAQKAAFLAALKQQMSRTPASR